MWRRGKEYAQCNVRSLRKKLNKQVKYTKYEQHWSTYKLATNVRTKRTYLFCHTDRKEERENNLTTYRKKCESL